MSKRGVQPPGSHEPGFEEEPITELAVPTSVSRQLPGIPIRRFAMGECSILLAREPAGVEGDKLWHLSIACRDRHPTWDEIKTARYRLLPDDCCVGMLLPPSEFYVNVPNQNHVFHLWEILDPREPWTSG